MKKYIAILGLGILGLTFSSCEKEPSFNYPEGTVGGSKVTVYPILTLKGDARVILAKGAAFTDAGATALIGSQSITPVITGLPDMTKAGFYNVTYTATNQDGFSASVIRQVIVFDAQSAAAAQDLSGTYIRPANGLTTTWTKIAPGFYSVVNPGGAVDSELTVVVFNSAVNTVVIPSQVDSDGTTTSSKSESYNPATKSYSWIIVNPGYGTALRTFNKQ